MHNSFIICNAKLVYLYKTIKIKLRKNNAAIWFNKTCRIKQLTPTYINIRVNGNNKGIVHQVGKLAIIISLRMVNETLKWYTFLSKQN
jgi:hypothetical protein